VTTLVIAPHADDELLGCGGTLLRRRAAGRDVAWVLVTDAKDGLGPPSDVRDAEIERVREGLGIPAPSLTRLGHGTTTLDTLPMSLLVAELSDVIQRTRPSEVLIPHPEDVHSDHRVTARAALAATKWFRGEGILRVLSYETLSETGIGGSSSFRPDIHIDISPWLDRKIALLQHYTTELGAFPFPRSEEAVRALAALRGANAGFRAAEAFQILSFREPLDESE
jgi:LmbE family N-acetylglucosaminyl deacetylase